MKILAIDPATKCGWAMGTDLYGMWNLTTRKDESSGMKMIRLKAKVAELFFLEKFDLLVYERVAGRNTHAVISCAKLCGVIESFCIEHNIEYRAYSATEIKKYATGKGNANKAAMIEAAKEKYGYQGNDDNEADAIHIWALANEEFNWI